MSRKVVLFSSALIMLVLALVVARVFREPLPQEEVAVVGGSVSGPLQTTPVQSLTSPLPPAEAMVMTSGDAASDALPVTTVEPARSDNPAHVATLVRDAPSGPGMVTEPPAAPAVPAAALGETAAEPANASAAPASSAVPPAAEDKTVPASSETPPSAPMAASPTPAAPAAADASAPAPAKPVAEPARSVVADNEPVASQTGKPAEKPLKPGTLVTRSSLPAKAGSKVVTSATLTMDGDVVTLRLQGTAAMQGKTFLLSGPDRVVLDVVGDWKMEAPRVPSNRMVRALRVGSQGTATRLVFDMKVKPVKARVTNVVPDTLELTIR